MNPEGYIILTPIFYLKSESDLAKLERNQIPLCVKT